MIISFTGPRPYKINCNVIPNNIYNHICKSIKQFLVSNNPSLVISGFAQGTDLWAASIAINLNIPVLAAIPFPNQEEKYYTQYKRIYHNLLSKTKEVKIISNTYSKAAYQTRNQFMVNNSDLLTAIYNPSLGHCGTKNCIDYATFINKPIHFIDPFSDI